ncbi:fimbrillin family protein, partial [Bacteroides pyogenes]|uniref:fimbrillin family protein n=1 Tax=Bacteroides pyogenes TaxID=310300 RepID=UPI002FD882BA
ANVATEIKDKFSAIGYNGATKEDVENIKTQAWFHNKETDKTGKMTTPTYWDKDKPYACFYGVSPYVDFGTEKIKLSDGTYTSTPYVDFKVEKEVEKQKDLMTAYSGTVHNAVEGTSSAVDLRFRHALTAVRFKVGQNLSYNKTIKKVEIRGAKSEGRYTLASGKDGNNAVWSGLKDKETFTLSDLEVSTKADVNQVIMGENNDNYVFYMLPQKLENVSVSITFADKTTVTTKLKGSWEPGTTKTYALSEKNSTWKYVLSATSPIPAEYTSSSTEEYTVQSYREVDGRQEPVAWQVVGYDVDGNNTFTMEEKPEWLTTPGAIESDGGVTAEKFKAKLSPSITNRLDEYNKQLQTAEAKGNAGNYYNLSNSKGEETVENTANSYLISAPGYYCIPLVYGNAIKGNKLNYGAFQTQVQGANVLKNFKDHNGKDIANAYIDTQNSENPATQASVVWEDQKGIVDNPYVDGYFVRFHISKEKIRSGNAVIAVKNAQGVIMWSWHLWFAQKEALDVIAVENKQGKTYQLTKENLGITYTKWQGSSYDKAREVRVKIEQKVANKSVKQFTYINIVQKPGSEKEVTSPLYQFGRKDPFPTDRYELGGLLVKNDKGPKDLGAIIQHPLTFYQVNSSSESYCQKPYTNLWSMNNTETGFNDSEVVKTIYDPCPVGFKMPPSNVFTGFTLTGRETSSPAELRVSGLWNNGWYFKGKAGSSQSLYFPAVGYRNYANGYQQDEKEEGRYWTAIPAENGRGCALKFTESTINPIYSDGGASAYAVRPIAEK